MSDKPKIFKQLKLYIYAIRDKNGNYRTVPRGVLKGSNIPSDRLKLLWQFVSLLLDTEFIHKESKVYLSNLGATMKDTRMLLADIEDKDIDSYNEKTIINRIYTDQKKVEQVFGNSVLSDILYGINTGDRVAAIIAGELAKLMPSSLKDEICLDIKNDCICTELDSERFQQFMETIVPYTKSRMRFVSASLDDEAVGYFNYLIYGKRLTDLDKDRLDTIKNLLG